jgi:phosphoglycerate dehydrogenase-like enzyme
VGASDKPALLKQVGQKIQRPGAGRRHEYSDRAARAVADLEIISVFGVGYDGVPVAYCKQRGIKVGHTPDVLTDDVADVRSDSR